MLKEIDGKQLTVLFWVKCCLNQVDPKQIGFVFYCFLAVQQTRILLIHPACLFTSAPGIFTYVSLFFKVP